MPALNFRKQFADLILSGKKQQTIRPVRKRPIKSGDNLFLYIGMRTKQCRRLGNVVCKTVQPIIIDVKWIIMKGHELSYYERESLAICDGFKGVKDFVEFFELQYGLPFSGVVIRW